MAEVDPSNTSLLMMLGDRWIDEDQPQRAHASFTAAAAQYSKQGDDERALAAHLKARAVRPDDNKTLAAIASLCTARGQAENAIPILRESLERNANDSELNRILGSTFLATGRLDEAERTFQKLLALDPSEYRHLLIVGERFIEQGDLDRAARQIDPFVDTAIASRDEQETLDFLHQILECDPGHLESLSRLASMFRRLREDFNLVPTLKSLAASASRRGDDQLAIEALKELCSLEPAEKAHRDALEQFAVEPPRVPCVVYSTAESAWNYTSSEDNSGSNVLRAAFDLASLGQSADATVLLRAMLVDEPDSIEVRLALKNIYATAGLLDLAANECIQIGRISQSRRSQGHRFIPAREVYEVSRFSNNNGSTGRNVNSSSTGFDLVLADDRRRAERMAIRLPLIVISDNGGWCEFTETVEVTEDGMQLTLAHTVAPMTALTLSLDMTNAPDTLVRLHSIKTAQAIVRYCNQRPNGANLVGLQLPALSEPGQYEAPPSNASIVESSLLM